MLKILRLVLPILLAAWVFREFSRSVRDESTTGAGERIAAFAQERKLALVVGSQTAGRLICCSVYKISHGNYVRIPARAWYTWRGELLEGKGVQPDCSIPNEQAGARDAQLERAVDVAAINQSLLAIVLPITNIPYPNEFKRHGLSAAPPESRDLAWGFVWTA